MNAKMALPRIARLEGFAKILGLLVLLLMAALLVREAALPNPLPRAVTQSARQTLADLPASAQAAISAGIGRDQAAYHAALRDDGSFAIANPAQNLHANFSTDTATVRAGDVEWNLLLSAWGYGETLQRVERVAPSATASRVEYPRGALSEWYVNGPQGLEQGFTIQKPQLPIPKSQIPSSNLTLALALNTDSDAQVSADGRGLTLSSRNEETVLRYSGLTAFDATGRELRAWMEMGSRKLEIGSWIPTSNLQPLTSNL